MQDIWGVALDKAQGGFSALKENAAVLLNRQVDQLQEKFNGIDIKTYAQETVSSIMGFGAGALPEGLESKENRTWTSRVSELAITLAARTAAELKDGVRDLDIEQLKRLIAARLKPLTDAAAIPQDSRSLRGAVVTAAALLLKEAQNIPEGRASLRGAIRDLTPEEREKQVLDRFRSADCQQKLDRIYLPAAYFSLRAYSGTDTLHQTYWGFEEFEIIGSHLQEGQCRFNLDEIRKMAPNFVASIAGSVPAAERYHGAEIDQDVSHHIVWGISRRNPDTLIIAQRGTQDEGDWLYNLSNYPRKFPYDSADESPVSNMVLSSVQKELDEADVTVAYGFWRKYRDVRKRFWDELEASQRSQPSIFESIESVVFAGHSLGGAAATYMASDALKLLYFPKAKRFHTVTFGAPPAADSNFYSKFYFDNKRNLMPETLEHTSFLHTRDAVAAVASSHDWVRSPGTSVNLGPIRIQVDSPLGVGPLTAHKMAYYLERVAALKTKSEEQRNQEA